MSKLYDKRNLRLKPMQSHASSFPMRDLKLSPPRIQAMNKDGIYRVIARGSFGPGALLLWMEGDVVNVPTRHSVQIGPDQHIHPPEGLAARIDDQKFVYRFLNHSCRPNAKVVGRQVISIQPIAPFEEVTFDYNTTELAMSTPFDCWCDHCNGRPIAGFSLLSESEQLEMLPYVAEHLHVFAMSSGLLRKSA